MIKKIVIFSFAIFFSFYLVAIVAADTMSNSQYILRWGTFNMVSGKPTGPSYKVSFTGGQTAPGLYSGANYKVRAGFQYIYSQIPFAFSMSSRNINFGTLTPGTPVVRDHTLTVSNQSANGYTVAAYENHSLFYPPSGTAIPDTTCDAGTCSDTSAQPWTSNLTYGFGYRCDAIDATNYCSSDFSDTTAYKQFTKSSTSAVMVFSDNTGRSQRAKLTYKVNISANQANGIYTNAIIYIATPKY